MTRKGETVEWVVVGAVLALAWTVFSKPSRPVTVVPARRERIMAGEYHDEYTDDERNKQLEIYRDLADDDKRWADRCSNRVNQLIRSLAPEDGSRDLFTFFERKAFDIPVTHRPRPKE